MKHYFPRIAALAVSLTGSVFVPGLKADEWDKKTNITINQSIDVQGTVLPPGSYVMKLLGSSPDRRTVLILNADENHLIATVIATPAYKVSSAGDSEFKFYQVADGQLPALRSWFYPGDNVGLEFRSGREVVATQSRLRHTNATTSNGGSD